MRWEHTFATQPFLDFLPDYDFPVRVPDPGSIRTALLDADPIEVLQDLFVAPRVAVRKWAEKTHQTTQAKTAYLGQHLASVLTAVPGEGTAARGHDLVDGTEVKTCSRADQLGSCEKCGARVPAWTASCDNCGSIEIRRKTDSHWLISVRRESELEQILGGPRVLFILFDRTHHQDDIRVRAWEVWPQDPIHGYLSQFLTDYFNNNFSKKRERAAPANLHPLQFDFLMMNPARVFDARLLNVDQPSASVTIDDWLDPRADRAGAKVETMPASICTPGELRNLLTKRPGLLKDALAPDKKPRDLDAALKIRKAGERRAALDAVLPDIPPKARLEIPMRAKRIKTSDPSYSRGQRRS